MSKKTKKEKQTPKKGLKTMRKPPAAPSEEDLDNWVQGANTKASPSTAEKASGSQVTSNLNKSGSQPTDTSGENAPTGTGIVERADGSHRRRLVVYLDPEHAQQLKVHSALHDQSMSDIVDELVGDWIDSKDS